MIANMKCTICWTFIFLCFVSKVHGINITATLPPNVETLLKNTNGSEVRQFLNRTRRILVGNEAEKSRPYMIVLFKIKLFNTNTKIIYNGIKYPVVIAQITVPKYWKSQIAQIKVYLKLPVNNPKYKDYRRWLCGGVIIHEDYILTSAACIEDAKNFYIVSGTFKHDENQDRYNNLCIKNGAKKAVWKCIPRNYVFDGHENDNIRWMNNDIAVVKVEDEFDFTRRVRGCDFVPKPICFNNQSERLEQAGNFASIAGWGTTDSYGQSGSNQQNLLDTQVRIISKNRCKKRWGKRYHNIIENYMICSKDLQPDMSEICNEKYVDCTDITDSGEDEQRRSLVQKRVINPETLTLHSAYHNESRSHHNVSGRRQTPGSGGFCENDHGGPLVSGSGPESVVIGIISACLVRERTNQCYGPFLYTSVYRNKNLISCAIYKRVSANCEKLFRSSVTHTEEVMSWVDHPDGPAKNELPGRRSKDDDDDRYEPIETTTPKNIEKVGTTVQNVEIIGKVPDTKPPMDKPASVIDPPDTHSDRHETTERHRENDLNNVRVTITEYQEK